MYCSRPAEMVAFWREWEAMLCEVCGAFLIQRSRENGNPPERVDLMVKEGECLQ